MLNDLFDWLRFLLDWFKNYYFFNGSSGLNLIKEDNDWSNDGLFSYNKLMLLMVE